VHTQGLEEMAKAWQNRLMMCDLLGPLHFAAYFDLPLAASGANSLQNPSSTTPKALHLAAIVGNGNATEDLLCLPAAI
jgi:hypothetical protein